MKKNQQKIHENYMLIRDDEGWKIIHPHHGAVLLGSESYDGFCIPQTLKFDDVVLYSEKRGHPGVLPEASDLDEALEQLEDDGYSKKDISAMSLRQDKIALFI